MAVTRIDLPAKWIAGIEGPVSGDGDWSSTTVSDPADPNYTIIAWTATSRAFGTLVGFDFEIIRKAFIDDANATMTLRMYLNAFSPADSDIGVHNLENAPAEYTSLGNVYNPIRHHSFGEGEKWIEVDLTYLRSHFLQNAKGISFLPAGMLDYASNPILILDGNWIPNRPQIVAPVGGVKEDRTKDITFTWRHDGVFPQYGYDIRYRLKGTTTWTEVSNFTSDEHYILPANTLEAGEYEWQVRTKMDDGTETGAVGPWSLTEVFNATEATNAPVIITPTPGMVMPTQDLHIEWEPVTNQTNFEIELVRGGSVVRSTQRTSSQNSITLNGWLENNTSYIVRLRVLAEGQFWSDWAEVNISVSYTPPARPILTLTPNEDDASIEIDVHNPPPQGTEPTPVSQELFRRERGGIWIKIADLVPNSDFIDYAVASEKNYEYRVVVHGNNNTSTTSNTFNGFVTFKEDILNVANEPSIFVKLQLNPARSFNTDYGAVKKKFTGRTKPVVEFGETIEFTSSLSYLVSEDDFYTLHDMASRQETILYRDPRGRKHYITIDSITVDDEIKYRDYYVVNLSISEVYYKEGID